MSQKIQLASSTASKDTIYIDVDDEITSIIDKVRGSKGKIVALVLPKRASALQSIVNMKLLKRTSDDAQKHLVLVTTEAGLMPLAGNVGLYVASSPTSKPAIPPAPKMPGDEPEDADAPLDVSEDEAEDFDPATAAATPVGELAAAGTASKIAPKDVDEDLSLDDDDDASESTAAAGAAAAAPKPKKNKKLKVPNFDSFRKKLALGIVGLIALIFLWILAFMVLPRATIAIHTDTSSIPTNLNLILDTSAKELDPASDTVPATVITKDVPATQQAAATGQQNNGDKASGTVTMTAQECGTPTQPNDIPAGTTISANNHTYVLQSDVTFSFSNIKNSCINFDGGTTDIQALKGGADYNVSNADFTVSGRSDITANGSAQGGTDNITKVVSQSDIDNATTKLAASNTSTVKNGMKAVLQGKGLMPIDITFQAGEPKITTSAKAGDAADSVTVTSVTTYTLLGVKQSDLDTLVKDVVTKQIDKGKQSILDTGVKNAKFSSTQAATAEGANLSMRATAVAGPNIDTNAIKQQIAGKKKGDVQNLIKQTPGVTSVDVKYSPFWVSVTPKNTSKIAVQLDKSSNQ